VALSEFEVRRCEKVAAEFIERRRPPPHLRHAVDLGFSMKGQSVEIFELRPPRDDESRKMERPLAKATFEKKTRTWKVYWQRADLKWHAYDARPRVDTLEEFFALLDEDPHACFFG
jgi:hypothetical protein